METRRTQAELGKHGEEIALQALIAHKYSILSRNWRWDRGEVDIVALDGDTLVFVEVRLRSENSYMLPEETVDSDKQAHLWATAEAYLEKHDRYWDMYPIRFDLVAIVLATSGLVKRLSIHQDMLRR